MVTRGTWGPQCCPCWVREPHVLRSQYPTKEEKHCGQYTQAAHLGTRLPPAGRNPTLHWRCKELSLSRSPTPRPAIPPTVSGWPGGTGRTPSVSIHNAAPPTSRTMPCTCGAWRAQDPSILAPVQVCLRKVPEASGQLLVWESSAGPAKASCSVIPSPAPPSLPDFFGRVHRGRGE